MKKNLLYAQSGGVTPVINATACGVIETARAHGDKIGNVYAGKDGIIGVLKEELIDTARENKTAIARITMMPRIPIKLAGMSYPPDQYFLLLLRTSRIPHCSGIA